MQAIEFNTVMKNGWLKVPHHYPDWENQSVKIIVPYMVHIIIMMNHLRRR